MSSDKPLLLLDIDGVLAPFLTAEEIDKIWDADKEEGAHLVYKSVRINMAHEIFVRHDLPEIMRELMSHFELMWGTAWGGEHANMYMLRHLGLEVSLDAIEYRSSIPGKVTQRLSGFSWESGEMPTFWKMPWIEQFAEESGRSFVFIDDEVSDEAILWAHERSASGIPTLMIKTDGAVGWTDDHKDELIAWAKEVAMV